MGVCISLVKGSNIYTRLGEWNGLAGNKALFHELAKLPKAYLDTGEPGDVIVRPTDFRPWRDFVASLPHNAEHFTEMLDRVEREPDLYLDFSY
jgi:hypothetical protein